MRFNAERQRIREIAAFGDYAEKQDLFEYVGSFC